MSRRSEVTEDAERIASSSLKKATPSQRRRARAAMYRALLEWVEHEMEYEGVAPYADDDDMALAEAALIVQLGIWRRNS